MCFNAILILAEQTQVVMLAEAGRPIAWVRNNRLHAGEEALRGTGVCFKIHERLA
jgi:hypothetical protein